MKVSAKTATKIKLYKSLVEDYKIDPLHAQIAKLKSKLKDKETAIKDLKSQLIESGQKLGGDYIFNHRGLKLASLKRNDDTFSKVKFFNDVTEVINASLGKTNALKAIDCIETTKKACTTKSGTWKLEIA